MKNAVPVELVTFPLAHRLQSSKKKAKKTVQMKCNDDTQKEMELAYNTLREENDCYQSFWKLSGMKIK